MIRVQTDVEPTEHTLSVYRYNVGVIPIVHTAQVGQTVVVKAVDENGKPTEWEASNKLNELSEEIEAIKEEGGISGGTTVAESGVFITMECDKGSEIVVTGETSEAVTLVHCGKNLLPRFASQTTLYGVTITPNADGSCTFDGTCTETQWPDIVPRSAPLYLPAGTYTLSAVNAVANLPVGLEATDGSFSVSVEDINTRRSFTIDEGKAVFVYFTIVSGATYEDRTIYVQLEAGSEASEYEPHEKESKNGMLPMTFKAYDGTNVIYSNSGDVLTATSQKSIAAIIEDAVKKKLAVDWSAYGVPMMHFVGVVDGMSKDNAVVLKFKYNDITAYIKAKWQGTSSLTYPEKNYTIEIYVDEACTQPLTIEFVEGWGAHNKFVAKADWVDASHLLNILGALIWGQIVKREGSNYPDVSKALPNGGAIDGFPVLLFINDDLQGLYTFTIPKDGWMAGMTGIEGEFILNADGNNAACAFKELPANDDSDFEEEFSASAETLAAGRAKLETCVTDTINAVSTGENVDKPFDNLNYDSALDYMVFCACLCNPDGITKNYQLFGRPSEELQFSAYDMDAILGNHWNGKSYYAPDHMTYAGLANAHNIFKLIHTYKKDDLKARHKLLRATILNEANILTTVTNYAVQIPSAVLDEDRKLWPGKPGTLTNDIGRIMNFLRARLAIVDAEIEAL